MATHSSILAWRIRTVHEVAKSRTQVSMHTRVGHKLACIQAHYPFNKLILLEEI